MRDAIPSEREEITAIATFAETELAEFSGRDVFRLAERASVPDVLFAPTADPFHFALRSFTHKESISLSLGCVHSTLVLSVWTLAVDRQRRKRYKDCMANTKRTPPKRTAVFALIDASQKAAIERLGRKTKRSIGFLVREAIEQYLAAVKKAQ
jgi:hypothetical protein